MGTLRLISVLLVAFTVGVAFVVAIGPKTTACLKGKLKEAGLTDPKNSFLAEEVSTNEALVIDYIRIEYGEGNKIKINSGSNSGDQDITEKPILTWRTKTVDPADHDTKYLLVMLSFEDPKVRSAGDIAYPPVFHWVVKNLKFADFTTGEPIVTPTDPADGDPTEVKKFLKPDLTNANMYQKKDRKYIHLCLVYVQPIPEPGEAEYDFTPGYQVVLSNYANNDNAKYKLGNPSAVNFFYSLPQY